MLKNLFIFSLKNYEVFQAGRLHLMTLLILLVSALIVYFLCLQVYSCSILNNTLITIKAVLVKFLSLKINLHHQFVTNPTRYMIIFTTNKIFYYTYVSNLGQKSINQLHYQVKFSKLEH